MVANGVRVQVDVLMTAVTVHVDMKDSTMKDFPDNIRAQDHQHHRHAKLQELCNVFVNPEMKQNHGRPCRKKGTRMADTPDTPNQ